MKLSCLFVILPLVVTGCASSVAYQAPLPGESSASLSIEFGQETGDVEIAYGKSDASDCFEYSVLHSESRYSARRQREIKQVVIPANGPQVLRYKRNDSDESCDINLRFLPQQGARYVLRTENRYFKSEGEQSTFFGSKSQRQCVVELYRQEGGGELSPVLFDRLPIKPTRMGYPGCPKILTKPRSAILVGSQRHFDLDTSGTMRRIP